MLSIEWIRVWHLGQSERLADTGFRQPCCLYNFLYFILKMNPFSDASAYVLRAAQQTCRCLAVIFLFTTIASFWNFSAPFPAPLPHLRFVFLILVSPPPVPGSESGAGAAPSESAPYDSPSPSQGVAPRAFPGFLSLNNLLSEYSSQRPDCLSHDALRNRSRRAEPTGSPKPKPLTRSRQWPWAPH